MSYQPGRGQSFPEDDRHTHLNIPEESEHKFCDQCGEKKPKCACWADEREDQVKDKQL